MRLQPRYTAFPILLVVVLAIIPTSVIAQKQDLNLSVTDRFLVLVPVRDAAEIQKDIDNAEQSRLAAVQSQQTATQQHSVAQERMDQAKLAIAANKDQRSNAKRENNASSVIALDQEGKALDREKKLVDQRSELRDAEINLAKMKVELATLQKTTFELERQLATKRTEWAGSGSKDSKLVKTIVDLEKDTLTSQKKVADKQGDVADGSKKVVVRQLKTLEAQRTVYTSKD